MTTTSNGRITIKLLNDKIEWLHKDILELHRHLHDIMWKVIGIGATGGGLVAGVMFLIKHLV
jgi:ABC-type phosphate/phosphonate transport system permease subunit